MFNELSEQYNSFDGKKAQCGFVHHLLGVQSVTEVMGGKLRWFGHLEHEGVDDRVSAC